MMMTRLVRIPEYFANSGLLPEMRTSYPNFVLYTRMYNRITAAMAMRYPTWKFVPEISFPRDAVAWYFFDAKVPASRSARCV